MKSRKMKVRHLRAFPRSLATIRPMRKQEAGICADLKAAYDHAPVLMCTLDRQRRVLRANRAFVKFTGTSEKKLLLGRACGVFGCINAREDRRGCGFGHDCVHCAVRRAIEDTLRSGTRHDKVEWRATLESGGKRREAVLLGSMARIETDAGPTVQLCLLDITDRAAALSELRQSEARYRSLFDNSLIGISRTLADGRLLAVNRAYARMYGYASPSELLRKVTNVRQLYADPEERKEVLSVLTENGVMGPREFRVVRRDGTRFFVVVAASEERDANGRLLYYQASHVDITERKLAESRIRAFSRRLLAVREEEKRDLADALHYDVGSMTVGVASLLEATDKDVCSGEIGEARKALKACRKLFDQSVKDLKELAVNLRPPDLDILGLRAALREHFIRVTRNTSLRVSFTDVSRDVELTPECQTILFRIAQESVNNVVKHAGAKRINVCFSVSKNAAVLSVADNGKGFNPDRTRMHPRLSMGIIAMREMAASHGGLLKIESRAGRGTKVTVSMPLVMNTKE